MLGTCLQFLFCLGLNHGSKLFKEEWVETCPRLAIHPIEGIGQRESVLLRPVPTEIVVGIGNTGDKTGKVELSRLLLLGIASPIVMEVMFIGHEGNQIGHPATCHENFSATNGVLPLPFLFI
jgi:hypothetical protein